MGEKKFDEKVCTCDIFSNNLEHGECDCDEKVCVEEVGITPEDYLENLERGREYHRLMEKGFCMAIKAYKAGYETGRADNDKRR